MPALLQTAARADAVLEGTALKVAIAGDWSIAGPRPGWTALLAGRMPKQVVLEAAGLGHWDSALLLFVFEVQQWCRVTGAFCNTAALPERVHLLLRQMTVSHETSVPFDRSENFFTAVGDATFDAWHKARSFTHFFGECVIGIGRVFKAPRRFRWADFVEEMQQCGAMALPIVSLVSFLVGVTLAYIGALVLRQYGGDIYVADLVGLSMVREMGALMTGVVLAGRTGAAYAATLGNMKANEEIDALETLGIPAIDFLVLPRLLALAVMMPLLTLYANALGIVGGMAVASSVLSIPPAAYWVEMLTIVDFSDLFVGVAKGGTFGLIIGLSGCLRGMEAERSAAGVGRAATSAVVTSILLIIVANALFAVVFDILGL
ncbi:putative phospholipid ABC transporter permease protein MlaE [Lacunisphaera limnophila]|uniref:Putative phospholipid ABC transporter permease protein MlaE n=1 Tax=Lacunisphaera limnophila TaxID=1838286 RepID=A0A1D8ART9_9BACT|nr:ABC transporter permease [Lacunisphaera limnophila]AOS43615.1 putative phospholipid ABC transporter permease protein MlaE [Lacunisphaera limnophila]